MNLPLTDNIEFKILIITDNKFKIHYGNYKLKNGINKKNIITFHVVNNGIKKYWKYTKTIRKRQHQLYLTSISNIDMLIKQIDDFYKKINFTKIY